MTLYERIVAQIAADLQQAKLLRVEDLMACKKKGGGKKG